MLFLDIITFILAAGVFSYFVPDGRASSVWSLLLLVFFGYFSYQFFATVDYNSSTNFILPWLKNTTHKIDLEIIINKDNFDFIVGLFVFTFFVLASDFAKAKETKKNIFNALVLLNLVFIITLVSANNYIQLLAVIGAIDVLVFGMIDNVEAKKRYIYSNLLADMGILSICAILLGQTGDVGLNQFNFYQKFGGHRDFVAIILLICVFIKSGLFMFNTAFEKLSSLKFNRLNFILFTTSPLVGFLTLSKMQPLLQISKYSYPILLLFSFLSIIFGAIGAISKDNLKSKTIYFSMMFWGLAYSFVGLESNVSAQDLSVLIIVAFLFNQILMLVHNASSGEKFVSNMGGFIKEIKLTWFVSMIVIFAYMSLLLMLCSQANISIILYLILFAICSLVVMQQIYLGSSNADERVLAMLKNPSILLYLPVAVCAILILEHFAINYIYASIAIIVWLVAFRYVSFDKLDSLYNKEWLQEESYVSRLYEFLLVSPIMVLGRVLWLTIDFMFVERVLVKSFAKTSKMVANLFLLIHSKGIYSYIFFTSLGFFIVAIFWYMGVE